MGIYRGESMKQRFDPKSQGFVEPPEIDEEAFRQAIWDDIGERFFIDFEGEHPKIPVIDPEWLPDGVTMGNVEAAIRTTGVYSRYRDL